jgi:Flp pilus assembly protein TadD
LEDYKGAISDYTKVIELDPSNANAYYSRGLTKGRSGDVDGGCLDLFKASELGHKQASDLIRENCH